MKQLYAPGKSLQRLSRSILPTITLFFGWITMKPWHKLVKKARGLHRLHQSTIMHLVNLGILGSPEISNDQKYVFFTDIQEALVKHDKRGIFNNLLFELNIPYCCKKNNPFFIHVPKCAGVSVSQVLYGKQRDHHSADYFKRLNPHFYAAVDSFAILREPIARTLSAFTHVLNQGGKDMPLNRIWSKRTRHIQTLDDYLDFLEDHAAALDKLDFVMRPQSLFVCDEDGQLIVDHIFCLESDMGRLNQYLKGFQLPVVPMANSNKGETAAATADQIERIRALYKQDFALYESADGASVAIP